MTIRTVVAVKYDTSGKQQWVARYNQDDGDPTDGPSRRADVAVDAAGDVFARRDVHRLGRDQASS